MKKTLIGALILFSAATFIACGGEETNPDGNGNGSGGGETVSVTGVTLDKQTVELAIGAKTALTATVLPDEATNKNVTWKSSDTTVATVTNGIVMAVSEGDATITVTTEDGAITADCTVTVIVPVWEGPDIYLAGYAFDDDDPKPKAILWKNGVAKILSDYESYSTSVYVSGDDVYVAGHIGYSNSRAVLWKNGEAQYLNNDQSEVSKASSVYVSGDDVYVAGYIERQAVLWKNGTIQELSDTYSAAVSVSVSGDDVYVAGFNTFGNTPAEATLWKNGTAQSLLDHKSEATAMYVSGENVYVTIYDLYSPTSKLWHNGSLQDLDGEQPKAYSVSALGSDVYVVGSVMDISIDIHRPDVAALWENGIHQTLLDEGGSSAEAIYCFGSDMYVVGNINSPIILKPVIWKNGVREPIDISYKDFEAISMESIFVK